MALKFGQLLSENWSCIGMYLIKVNDIIINLKEKFELAIEKLLLIIDNTKNNIEMQYALFWVIS